jgi:peptidoglycan/LPS O-acetylase OafA/YrhL
MEDVETLRRLTRNQVDFGGIAVSFFFAISGFLIVRSFEYSRSTYDYFIKRLLRILPGFFVAFLISVFLLGVLGTASNAYKWGDWNYYVAHLNIRRIIWQFFTLEAPKGAQTFLTNPLANRVNDSLWTIQYEFLCYMLVPLLGIVTLIKLKKAALLCFLAAFVVLIFHSLKVLIIYDNEWNWVLPYPSQLPRLFAFFFAGACFYLYRFVIVRSRLLVALSLVSLVVAAFVVPLMKIVLPVAGSYLLFYIAYHPRLRFYDFARRGDFSYGLYLYGWPIQQLTLHFLANRISPYALFLIAFPITLLFAFGSWHLVEHPFLKLKGKLRKGHQSSQVRVKTDPRAGLL